MRKVIWGSGTVSVDNRCGFRPADTNIQFEQMAPLSLILAASIGWRNRMAERLILFCLAITEKQQIIFSNKISARSSTMPIHYPSLAARRITMAM